MSGWATYLCGVAPGSSLGSVGIMEAAMPRINFWSRRLSRVELDERSREARLRLEQLERLFISHAVLRQSLSRRFLSFSFGRYGVGSRQSRFRGLLGGQRPSRIPIMLEV